MFRVGVVVELLLVGLNLAAHAPGWWILILPPIAVLVILRVLGRPGRQLGIASELDALERQAAELMIMPARFYTDRDTSGEWWDGYRKRQGDEAFWDSTKWVRLESPERRADDGKADELEEERPQPAYGELHAVPVDAPIGRIEPGDLVRVTAPPLEDRPLLDRDVVGRYIGTKSVNGKTHIAIQFTFGPYGVNIPIEDIGRLTREPEPGQ